MAISEQQRAVLIERLKNAREAKKAAKEAAVKAPKEPKAPKAPKEPEPKAPEPKAPEPKTAEPVPVSEPEPVPPTPTPVVHEIYDPAQKGTLVKLPNAEEEIIIRAPPKAKSKPIDIPVPAKKQKGYMKLKFYEQPSKKVMKRLMTIHESSSSSEEESSEDEPEPPKARAARQAATASSDMKRQHMRELADYYFNYF